MVLIVLAGIPPTTVFSGTSSAASPAALSALLRAAALYPAGRDKRLPEDPVDRKSVCRERV